MKSKIFGESRKGLHSYRICDTPLIDYIGTIIISMILSYYLNVSLVIVTIILFLISIILHYLFEIDTNSGK